MSSKPYTFPFYSRRKSKDHSKRECRTCWSNTTSSAGTSMVRGPATAANPLSCVSVYVWCCFIIFLPVTNRRTPLSLSLGDYCTHCHISAPAVGYAVVMMELAGLTCVSHVCSKVHTWLLYTPSIHFTSLYTGYCVVQSCLYTLDWTKVFPKYCSAFCSQVCFVKDRHKVHFLARISLTQHQLIIKAFWHDPEFPTML